MKIRLYFEKENLIRLAVAMVFAAVMFAVIRFPVWVLFGFGVLYFGIKSLKIELNEKMSWLWSSSQTLKEVSQLFNAITEVPNEFGLTGAYRFMGLITALWNAGRVQGIREERARRKRKAQTIEQ